MKLLTEWYVKLTNAISSNEKGQTIVEYALLLVLIAIVVIALITAVGRSSCNVYSTVNSALQPPAT